MPGPDGKLISTEERMIQVQRQHTEEVAQQGMYTRLFIKNFLSLMEKLCFSGYVWSRCIILVYTN